MKKTISAGLALGLALALWNMTAVETLLLELRQRFDAKQSDDLVAGWEVRFDAELDALDARQRALIDKEQDQRVEIQRTRLELGRVETELAQEERARDALAASLDAGAGRVGHRSTIEVAGRHVPADRARRLLANLEAEIERLTARRNHLTELLDTRRSVLASYAEARAELTARRQELVLEREEYERRMALLDARRELEASRELTGHRPAGRESDLDRLRSSLDEELLEGQAELDSRDPENGVRLELEPMAPAPDDAFARPAAAPSPHSTCPGW